jgi:hypothetical protein
VASDAFCYVHSFAAIGGRGIDHMRISSTRAERSGSSAGRCWRATRGPVSTGWRDGNHIWTEMRAQILDNLNKFGVRSLGASRDHRVHHAGPLGPGSACTHNDVRPVASRSADFLSNVSPGSIRELSAGQQTASWSWALSVQDAAPDRYRPDDRDSPNLLHER